jgi:hypothetical protein
MGNSVLVEFEEENANKLKQRIKPTMIENTKNAVITRRISILQ